MDTSLEIRLVVLSIQSENIRSVRGKGEGGSSVKKKEKKPGKLFVLHEMMCEAVAVIDVG